MYDGRIYCLTQEKLKNLFKARGITQQDVADRLGYWKSSISQWSNGKNTIPVELLDELAKLFDVDANYFYSNSKYYFAKVYIRDNSLISNSKDKDLLLPNLKRNEILKLDSEKVVVPIEYNIEDVFIITDKNSENQSKHLIAKITDLNVFNDKKNYFVLKDGKVHKCSYDCCVDDNIFFCTINKEQKTLIIPIKKIKEKVIIDLGYPVIL